MEHDTEKAPRDNLNSKTVFPSMIYSWMLLCVFKATFVILFRMQTEDIALLSTHFNNDFLSSSKDSLFCHRANAKSCKGTRLLFFALVGDLLTGRQRHSIEPVTGFSTKREDCVTICSPGVKREAKNAVPVLLFPTGFASAASRLTPATQTSDDQTKLCE